MPELQSVAVGQPDSRLGLDTKILDIDKYDRLPQQMAGDFLNTVFPDGKVTEKSVELIEGFRGAVYYLVGATNKEDRDRGVCPPGAVQNGELYPTCRSVNIDPTTAEIIVVRRGAKGVLVDQYNLKTGHRARPSVLGWREYQEDGRVITQVDTYCIVNRPDVGNCTITCTDDPADEAIVTTPKYYGRGTGSETEERQVGTYPLGFDNFYGALVAEMERLGYPPIILHQVEPVTFGQLAAQLSHQDQLAEAA